MIKSYEDKENSVIYTFSIEGEEMWNNDEMCARLTLFRHVQIRIKPIKTVKEGVFRSFPVFNLYPSQSKYYFEHPGLKNGDIEYMFGLSQGDFDLLKEEIDRKK